MTCDEKMAELNTLLANIEKRIAIQEKVHAASSAKYGRSNWTRPSRRLYVEHERIRQEIKGVEYVCG